LKPKCLFRCAYIRSFTLYLGSDAFILLRYLAAQYALQQYLRRHAGAVLRNADLAHGKAIEFCHILVDDVDLCPRFQRLLDTQVENGLALVGIRGNQYDMRSFLDVRNAVGHHPGPTCQGITWTGKVSVMVIDIGRADGLAQQLLEEVCLL